MPRPSLGLAPTAGVPPPPPPAVLYRSFPPKLLQSTQGFLSFSAPRKTSRDASQPSSARSLPLPPPLPPPETDDPLDLDVDKIPPPTRRRRPRPPSALPEARTPNAAGGRPPWETPPPPSSPNTPPFSAPLLSPLLTAASAEIWLASMVVVPQPRHAASNSLQRRETASSALREWLAAPAVAPSS